MAKPIINEATIEQLQWIFSEIAQTARALKRLAIQMSSEEEPDMIEQTPIIIEALCEKIGWAADLGGTKIGSVVVLEGDADKWMMPPAYHDAVKEVAHV